MKALFTVLLICGIATLLVLIGGTRLIFAIPGIELVALAGVLSLWPGLKSSRSARPFCLISVMIFIGYVLVRNRLSPIDYIARTQLYIAAGFLIVYLLVALLLDQPKERKWIFYLIIFLAFWEVVVGAIQFKEGNQWMPISGLQRRDDWWRASGLFISPNHYAGLLELAALMAFSFVVWGRIGAIGKILAGYVGLSCLAGVAISGSRGGYLSLAAGLVVLLVLCLLVLGRLRPEKLLPVGITALLATALGFGIVISLMMTSGFVKGRLQTIDDRENARFLLWDAALHQYKLSPVVGTGGFTYLYYGRLYRDPRTQHDPIHVHNDYLQLLADYGIIGAALFLVVYASHLFSGLRGLLRLADETAENGEVQSDGLALIIGSLSGLAAYTVHSVVDFNMQIPSNALVMAVLAGILANPVGMAAGTVPSWPARLAGGCGRFLLPALSLAVLIYGIRQLPGEWYAEMARRALRDYQLTEGLRLAEEGIKHEKNNPDLYYYAGESAREMAVKKAGEPDVLNHRAIEYFEKSLAVFPYDSALLFKLAQAQVEGGDYMAAVTTLDQAEELDPLSAYLLAYRGYVEQKSGDLERARDFYTEALEFDRHNPLANQGLRLVNRVLNAQKPLPVLELPPELKAELEEGTAEPSATPPINLMDLQSAPPKIP